MTRQFFALLAILSVSATSALAQERTEIRFTLDWKIQGVHAPFYTALENGYFEEEGLNVTVDQGEGSAATVTRIMSGAYDAGFGDMNAIIQNAATNPDEAPVMVYQIYNQPPFALLTKADGPLKDLSSLEGLTIGAPPGSAATKLFPALGKAAGFDPAAVEMLTIAPNLQEQVLIQDQVAGSLVFNVTSYLNIIGLGMDPDEDFTWYPYGEAGLDIYSNGVMVSRDLFENNKPAVEGLVRAINRGLTEVLADPDPGIALVNDVEPLTDPKLERLRFDFAVENLIVSEETRANGLGAVAEDRLTRAIETIGNVYDLETLPAPTAVYSDAFLPPAEERALPEGM